MFSKETYIGRRWQLKDEMKSGLLVFLGNKESGMNYADNTYRFRQDSSFLYYFGLDCADLAAIIDVDEDREIVFGDELTIDDIVWTGMQPTLKETCEKVGVSMTKQLKDLKEYIRQAQTKSQTVHFLPPYRGEHQVWLQELTGLLPSEQAAKASVPFIKAIVKQRNYKSEE
ncbi:MAG: aminopeptidase P N-terminal domain-containing protein, partial [Prevotella sp.]|nr:aminopeptidase P N-terminal domain-containing protein [Prevotella sp.]